jgi:hypothetical protein
MRLWHVDRSKGLDFLCKEIKVPDKILLIAFNMAARYFMAQKPRNASLSYYRDLAQAIERKDHSVEKVVNKAMEQSIEIWHEVKRSVNI